MKAPYRSAGAMGHTSACLSCGSEGASASTCATCDAIRPAPADEPALLAVTCVRCAVPTKTMPLGAGRAHRCETCEGIFVPPHAWAILMTDHTSVGLPDAPLVKPEGRDRFRLVRCPACDREMERLRFGALSDVVIDVCTARHGVWLDGGELHRLHAFVDERERIGAETLAQAAREKLGRELERLAQKEKKIESEQMRAFAQRPAEPHEAHGRRSRPAAVLLMLGVSLLVSMVILVAFVKKQQRPPTPQENRATAAAKTWEERGR